MDMVTNSDGSKTYAVYGTSLSAASGGVGSGDLVLTFVVTAVQALLGITQVNSSQRSSSNTLIQFSVLCGHLKLI